MKLRQTYLGSDRNSKALIELFKGTSTINRLQRLYQIFSHEEVLVTSSFGVNAAYLLYLINSVNPGQKIHFIDTGFHFKETMEYKERLTKTLSLNVVDVNPDREDHQYAEKNNLWITNPDQCCRFNKTNPLAKITDNFTVWMSGLIKSQSQFRSTLRMFEDNNNVIKFHPLYDLEYNEIDKHIKHFKLPLHPLLERGYESIGCTHCTAPGKGRSGRWSGKSKTECGLHLNALDNLTKAQLKVDTP